MAGSHSELLFFSQGEDIDILDVDQGITLVDNYTLTNTKDTIEVAKPFEYLTSSPYYFTGTGTFTTISGRRYNKTNAGPGYVFAYYNGTSSNPMLLSRLYECIKTTNSTGTVATHEFQFEYDGYIWWAGGFKYGFSGNSKSSDHYIDISAYAPWSQDSSDNYRLQHTQMATAALNIVYNKNIPIPQSL